MNAVRKKTLVPNLDDHRILLSDEVTQKKFLQAIQEVVKPGDVVLDLGTGTGIHAVFACRAGAKRVYAVEATTVIKLARLAARHHLCDDKIKFIPGFSHQARLPEKADVIMTYMGFSGTMRNLISGRRRFLKKGGRLVPCAVEFTFVPVEDPLLYRERVDFWSDSRMGLNFDFIRPFIANCSHSVFLEKKSFLAAPKPLTAIDLTGAVPDYLNWTVRFVIERPAAFHGLGGWYSYKLSDKVTLSPEPPISLNRKLWQHIFLPLEAPVRVKKGEKVHVELGLCFGKSVPHGMLWNWDVRLGRRHFRQSSLKSMLLSPNL